MSKVKKVKCCNEVDESGSERETDFSWDWDLIDVLAEKIDCKKWALKNVVNLLEEGNTVPFVARYRKEETDHAEAETIREVKQHLEYLRMVQTKAASVYNTVKKLGKATPEWKQALAHSQTLDDVEHLYAPYKPGSKGTLAERARELGLEPFALKLITPPGRADLRQAIKPNVEGLSSLNDVKKGVQHIIADIISKNPDIMKAVRGWCNSAAVLLQCTQVKASTSAKSTKSKPGSTVLKVNNANSCDANKFQLYFNFSAPVRNLRPHQVLAINRGVSKKVLKTKILIPESVSQRLLDLARRKFLHSETDVASVLLISQSIQDAYARLIEPLMMRHFKSELTKMAEKASIDVFASNLKKLLLTPPVRGQVILGVDPGFKHGCKYAVISPTGQVLDTGVFYPHTHPASRMREIEQIRSTIIQNRCEVIGIGNGTACRETESFFSDHITRGTFKPIALKFCIVNESGASIYSASPEAAKEMPDLDVSLRGAVSIARRLQDPLAELVKIDPKHIGVGMYQHDIPDSQLKSALDGVVEDCVSFVGADLNVASEVLLKHIAGLTATMAKNIVKHRVSKGAFVNREQLTSIKGLGPKTYKQCAGFIRIMPENAGGSSQGGSAETMMHCGKKRKIDMATTGKKAKRVKAAINLEPNPLDMTSVHPESYHIADKLLSMANVNRYLIGTKECIDAIKMLAARRSVESLSKELDTGIPTLSLILDALQQEIGHDIRDEFEKPLFRSSIKQLSSLHVGDRLTGRVTNIVDFGAFVDVGVGRDGLIHSSQIRRSTKRALELGDRVEVYVAEVDVGRGRIGLRLEAVR